MFKKLMLSFIYNKKILKIIKELIDFIQYI